MKSMHHPLGAVFPRSVGLHVLTKDGYKPEARSTTRQGDRDWLATLRQARVVCSHIKLNAHGFLWSSVPVSRQWTHPGDFLHVSSSFVLMDTCSHPDAACVHLHEHWWTHAAAYPACVHISPSRGHMQELEFHGHMQDFGNICMCP